MTAVVVWAPYVALICAAGFGAVGPLLSRAASPGPAAWLLTLGALTSAVASVVVLATLALPLVGRDDSFADYAHISASVLAKDSRTGLGVAATALIVLVALLARFAKQIVSYRRAFSAAARFSNAVSATPGRLVVLPVDTVDAYALAGSIRVVVATRGLLRTLSPEERRAVLAHEHAHLRHHHHRHLSAVTLAAALNPLLAPIPRATAYAIERWADEVSAHRTSRETTAAALTHLVEANNTLTRPSAALAAASCAVARRIAALQMEAPRTRPLRLAVPMALPALAVVAAGIATGRGWTVLMLAMHATRHVLPHR